MKDFNLVFVFFALFFGLFSCKSGREATQGLRGQVFWVEGNLMPQASEDVLLREKDVKKGVQRQLKVFTLTNLNEVSLADYLIGDIQTKEIMSLETDPEGKFEVELPTGKYSIFTVEEEGYFANVYDIENNLNPVDIKEGKWSFLEIIINYRAVY